jgi:spore coat polysaccharide biosynthesis protein SpsF (cytidylyltransferase family)
MSRADQVAVATTTDPEDDALVDALGGEGIKIVRGDPVDVLDRYRQAAEETDADVIVRITCDCPLIDPAVCDAVVDLRAAHGAPYASNIERPEWPHGLDCEVFTRATLEHAVAVATAPAHREHVTLWHREQETLFRPQLPGPGGLAASYRWTLDYPEDYDFLSALFVYMSPPYDLGWRQLVALMEENPKLAAINAAQVDQARRISLSRET